MTSEATVCRYQLRIFYIGITQTSMILHFKISVNELFFPGCFLNLWGLFDEIDQLEGVLMCSIFMLPPNTDDRKRIYKRLLKSRAELHFVLESFILRTWEDSESLETIFQIREQLPDCLTSEQLLKVLSSKLEI